MNILIIEDDSTKYGRIVGTLSAADVASDEVVHAISAAEALEHLQAKQFDLMLLDVNIPRRLGEPPIRGGGLEVLRQMNRSDLYRRPLYIVGVTAYSDVIDEFRDAFDEYLWTLIWYSDTSDRWMSQLHSKLEYVRAAKTSMNFSDGVTYGVDFAIICALENPELAAIRDLPLDWQSLRLPHDEARYLAGSFTEGPQRRSVVAAVAPRMGMPASSVLAAKVIHQFRPRFLIMAGICAGRRDKVQIGDVIIADPTWDWGSGKIAVGTEGSRFLPSPHQLDLDIDVVETLKELKSDAVVLERVRRLAKGNRPPAETSIHVGPLASGAAVVAHGPTFDGLVESNRGLLGIDMEAYGIAAAAQGSGRPRPHSLIIKSVCDFADHEKDDDYQSYASSVSALVVLEVMHRLCA